MKKSEPPIPQLKTAGVIAQKLGIPIHRVQYILRTRSHIRPTAKAGTLRLYDNQAVSLIMTELQNMAR